MKTTLRSHMLFATLCAAALLGACGNRDVPYMLESSRMNEAPITLEHERVVIKKPVSTLQDSDIEQAASQYTRKGEGPLYIVVSESAQGGKTNAPASAITPSALAAKFASLGVPATAIIASSVPQEQGPAVVLIAFDALGAKAPEDCQRMPGMDSPNTATRETFDYKLGCGVKDMVARQVAKPSDLMGVAGLGGENDGQRAANVVDANIRDGKAARDPVPGYSLGGVGASN